VVGSSNNQTIGGRVVRAVAFEIKLQVAGRWWTIEILIVERQIYSDSLGGARVMLMVV
jgi:hypothetical protein